MTLAEWYPQVRTAHIAFVTLSGTLFAARAAGVWAGARWPLAVPVRVAVVVVDTLLLSAGATLWATLGLNPLRDAWLGTKLALLVAYVGLGTMTLRRARGPVTRAAWTLAALACFGIMVGVARAHHPLGWLRIGLTG